ncbi:translocation/assembly module TamB domain-containing protein [Mangrovimonas futianensis]|uniref:translocation/assembly module TamB domain-containing protein n=1 Tax=Mangrovimonas futianensis TaxID=2895523 RepID=UPI001E530730|nr:translocation/assembly module TamB domain-containing protein [Mangrovimonas futianensis]MCF1423031.1 translocation/assembly module TamB [Mangrovimonas futianensis]
MSTDSTKTSKKRRHRVFRILVKVFLVLLVLFILLVVFIRSPWGQDIIVHKAIDYVTNKTHSKIELKKAFITFDGDIQIEGLYVEDQQGDTLVYSKRLEANMPLWALITGKGMGVDDLEWEGLRANIIRKDSINGFNFQFLIDAFTSNETPVESTQDTVSKPFNLVLGSLDLKDFNIVYIDQVTGIQSTYKFKTLEVDMDETNLETMTFKVDDLELQDAFIDVTQTPVIASSESETSILPFISVDNLTLNKVKAHYKSIGDGLEVNTNIDDFNTEIESIDLTNQAFVFGELNLKQSQIDIKTTKKNSTEFNEPLASDSNSLEWPDLQLTIGEIDFEDNQFSFISNNQKPKKGTFNPEAVVITNFNLQAANVHLKDKTAGLELNTLNFNEASGINVQEIGIGLTITDQNLKIQQLNAAVNQNKIKGSLDLQYASLASFLANPEQAKVNLNLANMTFDLNDVFKFEPSLRDNSYMQTLGQKALQGNLKAQGTLSDIQISHLNIQWGKETQIDLKGQIKKITTSDSITFDIPKFRATTVRSDLIKFASEDSLGIQFPETVNLQGKAKGNLNNIRATALLNTSQGNAKLEGFFNKEAGIHFDVDGQIDNYQLNELLKNEDFGALSLSLKANGSGSDINHLNAQLDAVISEFKLKQYDVTDLSIQGNLENGQGHIISDYKDDNLNMNLDALVTLDSIAPEAKINLNVIGANLNALGITDQSLRTGFQLEADFKGNSSSFDVETEINEGVIVYDNKRYLLGDLQAQAHVRPDTTSVTIHNKIIDADLESNSNPQTFSKALSQHIQGYFYRDLQRVDTLERPVKLKFKGTINPSPLLNEVLLVNVEDLDTIQIAMDFDEMAYRLDTEISAPHINYDGNKLDSLHFDMLTDKEHFDFNFRFKELTAGPLVLPQTIFSGHQENHELSLQFIAKDQDTTVMRMDSKITGDSELLHFHIEPETLVLNKNNWQVPATNQIDYSNQKLTFQDVLFQFQDQKIQLTHEFPNIQKDHVAMTFKQLNLEELLGYFNPDKTLATGLINGDLIVEDPFGKTGLNAQLDINQLHVLDVDLGTLSLKGKPIQNQQYDFYLSTKGGMVDLDLKGDYLAGTERAALDLDLNINEFQMKALEGFSMGALTDTNGNMTGKFQVNGAPSDLKYQGQLDFNNAAFNIAKFNAAFTLKQESVQVTNEKISLSKFTVLDANNNPLILTGDILTENTLNPSFNLQIQATNFQLLNASADDNDFVYGKAVFDATASLTGNLQIPKLDVDATVGNETDISYIMPSASVNMEQRDGVVIFVNKDHPDAILTQTEETTSTLKGFDIKARVKVKPEAAVTIIINEKTNDNFKVSGEGDFVFNMKPNGQMTLSGVYDVTDGHYEMSLYNLVNRRFDLSPGSRVTWSGDPFDAALDIKALYEVKASASALMATQTSGSDPSLRNKFRQVLPFEVYLNIDGELMQPVISFNIDMPENERGAINGQVYGRVQQLNQQEEELNKQVFSLLVLNRFYPEPGSDGSNGGMASVARDNLNDAVSDQLNMFSDKLLGKTGFELDFGLDSFTDYQGSTPQDRTQLEVAAKKKLFNDRLTVSVGSEVDIQGSNQTEEETPVIGNVTLEYLLTKNGRYRIKGFRRNEFENVIDGQTMVSGIALIFTMEFNKFSEFWHAIFHPEDDTQENESQQNQVKE